MAGGKRPAPFRTRKLSRLCADGTATGGSWESKTLPQSTVSWGWGTGLETGQYPTPPFYAHTQARTPSGADRPDTQSTNIVVHGQLLASDVYLRTIFMS